ncbi:hypothetical protein HO173_002284 [Letharia columbiana]|uniref:Uncharacterized protein n=1 Tax=Letharia columbiana TaxID=112416 RepID=A0A8H6L8L7_9LECA|nr:uncharacterized protein HO173_002284 [Letharia columbiana]KAF6239738.1 hypothetical protein HO173_002284 [Letharia columbiana]
MPLSPEPFPVTIPSQRSAKDPDLISSLRQSISALANQPHTPIAQHDVEIAIVAAFIYNLLRRGGDENDLALLITELNQVGEEIEGKLRAIRGGLG